MRERNFLFDSLIVGIACLFFVCVIPAISPILSSLDKDNGTVAFRYVMYLVAMVGILYEFRFHKEEKFSKQLRTEIVSIWVITSIFLILDLVFLFIVLDGKGAYLHKWLDYCLAGYAVAPFVVSIVEIVKYYREHYRDDNKDDGKKLAVGEARMI